MKGLYEGRYVPGQRLVESDLGREYRVGRGCIREALNRLTAEGIVTSELHRGAQIRALTRDEVQEMLAVLEMLVGLAARLAAEHIDSENHRRLLRDALAHLKTFTTPTDFFEFVRARNRFYQVLLGIGGNAELRRLLPGMHTHLVRSQFRTHQHGPQAKRLKDYVQIADAVMAGDASLAERTGRQHIRRVAQAIDALPDEAFAAGV